MVGQQFDQVPGADVGADIEFGFENDAVTRQTPLANQSTVVDDPIAAHGDKLRFVCRAEAPDVVEVDAETHHQAVVIFQVIGFAWRAVFRQIQRSGAGQAPLLSQASAAQ